MPEIKICSVTGCQKPRKNKGRTKSGIKKYATKCREHLRKSKIIGHTFDIMGINLGYKGNSVQSMLRKM